jgi:hypothetical protein
VDEAERAFLAKLAPDDAARLRELLDKLI